MNAEWTQFLTGRGARYEADRVVDIGDPPREAARHALDHTVVTDLSHRHLVHVVGEDAERFLHNQLTSDVAGLAPDQGRVAGYCTPKGRLVAILWMTRIEGGFRLRLPASLVAPTREQLLKYRLRSRCEITDVSDHVVQLGVSGPEAESRLREALGEVPEEVMGVSRSNGIEILRVPGPWPRFEVAAPPAGLAEVWTALAEHARAVPAAAWDLLSVRAGIPELDPATSEAFVPQMVNLHSVGGISFSKGCFPGQEVVARLRYLGELKRRAYRARVLAGDDIPPGTAVRGGTGDTPGNVGQVLVSAPTPDGTRELFLVLQIAAADHPLRLGDDRGPSIELLDLPYDVATALEKGTR